MNEKKTYSPVNVPGDGLCLHRAGLMSLLYQNYLLEPSNNGRIENEEKYGAQQYNLILTNAGIILYQAYKLVNNKNKNGVTNRIDFKNKLNKLKTIYETRKTLNSSDRKEIEIFLEECVLALIFLSIFGFNENLEDITSNFDIETVAEEGCNIFNNAFDGSPIAQEKKNEVLFLDRDLHAQIREIGRYFKKNKLQPSENLIQILIKRILFGKASLRLLKQENEKWLGENKNINKEYNTNGIDPREENRNIDIFLENVDENINQDPNPLKLAVKRFNNYYSEIDNRNVPLYNIAQWKAKFETAKRGLVRNYIRGTHLKRFGTRHDLMNIGKALGIRTAAYERHENGEEGVESELHYYQNFQRTSFLQLLFSIPSNGHFQAAKLYDEASSQNSNKYTNILYNQYSLKFYFIGIFALIGGALSASIKPVANKIDKLLSTKGGCAFAKGALAGTIVALLFFSVCILVFLLKIMSDYIDDKIRLNEYYDFEEKEIVVITTKLKLAGIIFIILCLSATLGAALGTGAAFLNGKIDQTLLTILGVSSGLIIGLLISYYHCSKTLKQDPDMPKVTLGFRTLGIIGACISIGLLNTQSHWIKSFNPAALGELKPLQQGAVIGAEITLAFALLPTLFFFACWAHSAYIHKLEKEEEENYLCLQDDFNFNVLRG